MVGVTEVGPTQSVGLLPEQRSDSQDLSVCTEEPWLSRHSLLGCTLYPQQPEGGREMLTAQLVDLTEEAHKAHSDQRTAKSRC